MEADLKIQERLVALAEHLDWTAGAIALAEVRSRALELTHSRRAGMPKGRSALVGAVVLALMAMVGVVVIKDSTRRRVELTNGATSGLRAGQCRALPPSPLTGRSAHLAIWTGEEMIVWGGFGGPNDTVLGDGAAYNPKTRRWRRLPNAPIGARSNPVGVWTGSEMIVWGGDNGAGDSLRDGAAYNPTTNSWRRIRRAPVKFQLSPAVLWTGRELVVFGGFGTLTSRHGGAAYDPTTNRWRRLSSDPFEAVGPMSNGVWTGNVAVFITNVPRYRTPTGELKVGVTRVASYDPKRNRWRTSNLTFDELTTAAAVWDGADALVFTNRQTPRPPDRAVDPRDLRSRELSGWSDDYGNAALTFSSGDPLWIGDRVLFWGSGLSTSYDPRANKWSEFTTASNLLQVSGETTLWTGQLLIAWGGYVNGRGIAVPIKSGVAYRPPNRASAPGGLTCPERQTQARTALTPESGG